MKGIMADASFIIPDLPIGRVFRIDTRALQRLATPEDPHLKMIHFADWSDSTFDAEFEGTPQQSEERSRKMFSYLAHSQDRQNYVIFCQVDSALQYASQVKLVSRACLMKQSHSSGPYDACVAAAQTLDQIADRLVKNSKGNYYLPGATLSVAEAKRARELAGLYPTGLSGSLARLKDWGFGVGSYAGAGAAISKRSEKSLLDKLENMKDSTLKVLTGQAF